MMATPAGSDVHRIETEIFGREVSFAYDSTWVGRALVGMRVLMGWILLQGGLTKLFDPDWTAQGFLANAIPPGNPFMDLWSNMAGNVVIDQLVIWGLTLTGLGLILGAAVRWNAFWAAVMMLFFWASSLEGGLLQGLPVAHGWVVDDHLVYVVLLFGLGAFGAGRILGVDRWLEETQLVQNNPWLKKLLG